VDGTAKLKDKIRFFTGLRELVEQLDDGLMVERDDMVSVDLSSIMAKVDEDADRPPLPDQTVDVSLEDDESSGVLKMEDIDGHDLAVDINDSTIAGP
jgi:uncharacterized UBP type Zn finger protein